MTIVRTGLHCHAHTDLADDCCVYALIAELAGAELICGFWGSKVRDESKA